MLKDTMSAAHLSFFTEIATLLAVALFVGALLYVFVLRKKSSWKAVSELPLHDEAPAPRTRGNDDTTSREPSARGDA